MHIKEDSSGLELTEGLDILEEDDMLQVGLIPKFSCFCSVSLLTLSPSHSKQTKFNLGMNIFALLLSFSSKDPDPETTVASSHKKLPRPFSWRFQPSAFPLFFVVYIPHFCDSFALQYLCPLDVSLQGVSYEARFCLNVFASFGFVFFVPFVCMSLWFLFCPQSCLSICVFMK